MALQFRRGAATGISSATVANGEPLYDNTNHRLYLGHGSTAHLIGSPRATEWAQCQNTLTSDICESTTTAITWDTSGTFVSDSDLFTVASAGITVVKLGTYLLQAQIMGTGASNSTSKPLELAFTVNGTGRTFKFSAIRSGTLYQTTYMQEIVRLSASDVISVESKRGGTITGDVDAEAGSCLLSILRLDAE